MNASMGPKRPSRGRVPKHDVERSIYFSTARHTVIYDGNDVAMLVVCQEGELVLKATFLVGGYMLFLENLQCDRCIVWPYASVYAARSTFTDQFIDNIDTERRLERDLLLQF